MILLNFETMRAVKYLLFIYGIALLGCGPKKGSEGHFENYVESDCSELSGCEQLSCVMKGCWCFKTGAPVLFESGLSIQSEENARSAVDAYFRKNPSLQSELIESETYGYGWYTLYYEGDAYTVGPDGNLYLVDCI
jgi:hypothetical protein